MFLSHLYDGLYVIVVEGIIDRLSLAAALYELARLKCLELMRYGGLIHLDVFTYLTDVLFSVKEIVKDLDACGIREHLEELRQLEKLLFAQIFYHVVIFCHLLFPS